MPCPHGHNSSPDTCSQCLQVRAKIVSRDAKGNLFIDGKPLPGITQPPPIAYNYAGLGTRKRRPRCKHCKVLGHKTEDCRELN